MKKVLMIILALGFVLVVVMGNSHWKKQIHTAAAKHETLRSAADDQTDTEGASKFIALTKNWPSTAVDQFKQALEDNRPYKILFVGSPAIGSEDAGMFPLVKEQLDAAFGAQQVQVSVKTFDLTTRNFLNSHRETEISAEGADMIILEPFLFLNNGVLPIKQSLKDVQTILEDLKAAQTDVTILLQPSYPVYRAKTYPTEVDALKKWAETNQITYLNHWTAWPDYNASSFKPYMLGYQRPSDKGNQVWSDYLVHYLVSQ